MTNEHLAGQSALALIFFIISLISTFFIKFSLIKIIDLPAKCSMKRLLVFMRIGNLDSVMIVIVKIYTCSVLIRHPKVEYSIAYSQHLDQNTLFEVPVEAGSYVSSYFFKSR